MKTFPQCSSLFLGDLSCKAVVKNRMWCTIVSHSCVVNQYFYDQWCLTQSQSSLKLIWTLSSKKTISTRINRLEGTPVYNARNCSFFFKGPFFAPLSTYVLYKKDVDRISYLICCPALNCLHWERHRDLLSYADLSNIPAQYLKTTSILDAHKLCPVAKFIASSGSPLSCKMESKSQGTDQNDTS